AQSNSLYALLGVSKVDVSTAARFDGTTADEAQETAISPLGGIGYQGTTTMIITPRRMVFDLGVLYGKGYAVAAKARGTVGGATSITDIEIRDSLFFEATMGILF
ncbi:MAG: hypothetical protein V4736_09440, partial [Bdellovibrionota bacterium]